MSRFDRLLILSATYGEGHQQAAYAVRDALAELSPNTEVKVVDYIKSIHPVLDTVVRYCYLKSVRFAPALYGWFYKGTSQIPPSSRLQRQLNSLGLEEMEETLNAFRPDVVLSTFPTPAGVVSHLKQKGRTHVPTAIAITDHAIHSQWIHPLTDMYYVGSEHVRRGLLARGIPGESVLVTGIPIRPAFRRTFDRAQLRAKYGIEPDIPVLLIMGGAYGVMGDLYHVCEQLFQWHHRIQVIIVTGRNRRLKTSLEEILPKAANPVQVYGFVQEIWELMSIADLMLTKAGGLTISEALALQVPMLLYRPIPGQEVQNAKFLVRSGVAVLARNRREVFEHIHDLLLAHPEKRRRMQERALGVRQLHAAERIAENLIELANRDRTRANYSYQ